MEARGIEDGLKLGKLFEGRAAFDEKKPFFFVFDRGC